MHTTTLPLVSTPNLKALRAIGLELASQGFRPNLMGFFSDRKPCLIMGKITITLKWEIDPYEPEEQPESYTEQEYYLDEACLEISVCGIMVESTMCVANLFAKMREIKTLNPTLEF